MPGLDDTQPRSPFDTQPKKPTQQPKQDTGPGCAAWVLVSIAMLAFSLILVIIAGLAGYITGQSAVDDFAVSTQQAFVQEQLTTWIPRDIEQGNVALLEARVAGIASLTPPPPELADLIVTATQFAIDMQPTETPTPTVTPTLANTNTPTPTQTLIPTTAASTADPNAPLFDINALYNEAVTQMQAGEFDEATKTLDAIMALDENFRSAEVEGMMLDALTRQATILLRSGNPGDLSAGIIKANEAEEYGSIGDLDYERYIAGIYLNAISKEATNPQGAIENFSTIFAQAPNYLDVRQRLFQLRVDLGTLYQETLDYCAAATQFQAALQIQTAVNVETQLQTAQTACNTGQSPVGGTVQPGDTSPDGTGTTTDGSVTQAPVGQPAPIGQRP